MSEAPAFLQLQTLSDEDEALRVRLISRLRRAQRANLRQMAYYKGARRVRDLGIAIPPHLRDVEAVIAWPEIVVDVLSERLRWRGWTSDDDLGLAEVYDANHLKVESGQGFLSALIHGLSYLTVGTGEDDEPDVLVTPHSPNRMTATWDPRKRRASNALAEIYDDRAKLSGWNLYKPGVTITTERVGGRLRVANIDEHGLDRIPVAVLRNRPQEDQPDGRSEITRAVRSHTDNGMRTILGMEISREFYGSPQRYLMGADESMFVGADGEPVSQWAAIIGRMLMAPRDENDELPTAGQFSAASPQPYSDMLRTLTQLVSSATGIPAHHLGFTTDNPSSAEALDAADGRLNQRAVDRQDQYDLGLVELGELVCLWRDGVLPEPGSVGSLWTPVGMVSPGAAADRASKMISAGVLDPSWDFTLEQFGLTDEEIKRVRAESLRSNGRSAIATLGAAAEAARSDQMVAALSGVQEDPASIKAKADAMGILIRSGADAASAAAAVGLTGLEFTGAVPVSLRLPQADAADLEGEGGGQ